MITLAQPRQKTPKEEVRPQGKATLKYPVQGQSNEGY